MKKLIYIFILFSSYAFSQGYDFQQLCLDCAAQNGFFCGDDPANWTQYSPNGCVPNGEGGLFYLNDGWADCVNGDDENGAEPTLPSDCLPNIEECDTVFIEIPFIEWIYDTIVEVEFVYETEYVYITDTIVEIEYEYITEYIMEFVDCNTGLPCGVGMEEVIDKSINTGLMYNLWGQAIRKPEGIYIEGGKVKYKTN
jgi:hypothetical protein|tara:strand:+ start:16490 stop:17080 length:591 start_codon:yes stop_codon:yes gene_type:complete